MMYDLDESQQTGKLRFDHERIDFQHFGQQDSRRGSEAMDSVNRGTVVQRQKRGTQRVVRDEPIMAPLAWEAQCCSACWRSARRLAPTSA